MPQLVADRFVRLNGAWIDLGTARFVKLRVLPAGSTRDQILWNSQCAALADLRHPLLNALIDYGLIDNDRRFEAYLPLPPLPVKSRRADQLIAHARRFVQAHVASLKAPDIDPLMRSMERHRCCSSRPIGLVLQPRAVYNAIADALDLAWPIGPSLVYIGGSVHSGLRTTRLIAARLARLRGYMPIDAGVLEKQPEIAQLAGSRHVCLLADERLVRCASVRALLSRLSVESARRHVLFVFTRTESLPPRRCIAIERMGVIAMSGMVFVDREQGPKPADILDAARMADGRPGIFLDRLGSAAYDTIRAPTLTVHEVPEHYGSSLPTRTASVERLKRIRGDDRLRGAIAHADALVVRGRHASASRSLSRATRVLLGRGAHAEGADVAIRLGFLSLDRGYLQQAVRAFEQAREATPETEAASVAAIGLGLARIDQGRLVEAEGVLRTATLSFHSRSLRMRGVSALARALYWMGRLDEARLALDEVQHGDNVPETARMLAMRARIELADGLIPAAVRSARSAVDLATELRDFRTQTAACRSLAAALASAGDDRAAALQIRDGLRAATAAHLPLAAARLRLTFAEIGAGSRQHDARRLVLRIIARSYPPLLQAVARAVLARIDGTDLDPRTKSFIASSGAALIGRSSPLTTTSPVADLESLLATGHTAPDDLAAIEGIAELVRAKLRATTVIVAAVAPEHRVLSVSGRPWQGDPHIAWRAAGTALGIPIDSSSEPCQAAEPIRYSAEVIGAIAIRWTAGVAVDSIRTSAMLRIAALAIAAHVRAVLDRSHIAVVSTAGDDLLGDSQPACTLRDAIARAARAPFPVLIQGESGSGKELVARTIHRLGSRRDRRFCALNCAALSDDLIEAELFGHARGAFTGAVGERAGLFEEADGGMLFMDEIGELSARAQAKLLRVLQDGEVRRVGENLSRRVDVRIVAATNRRLDQEAAAGRFRADLRFRLDVIRIDVPPLRERPGDVPLLASRFWNDAAGRIGSRATLGPEAVAALARYEWPGNVRELQNVIAWIAVQSPRRGRIGAAGLPAHIARASPEEQTTFEAARQDFERRFVKAALARADGQRARAAEALGITRQGLAKMIRRLRIE